MYPVGNAPVTLDYGVPSKIHVAGFHDGVDFGVPVGTPVRAMRKGKITARNWGKDYGIHIVQRRTYPVGTKNHLIYAHLSKSFVKPGQRVKKGQIIGLSGNTGKSTGAHLHVGERNGARWSTSKPVNPWGSINA